MEYKICRICLKYIEEYFCKNIFNKLGENYIFQMIMEITPIQIKSNEIPEFICELCTKKLAIAHDFFKTAVESDKKLKNNLITIPNQDVKIESDNNGDENVNLDENKKNIMNSSIQMSKKRKKEKRTKNLDKQYFCTTCNFVAYSKATLFRHQQKFDHYTEKEKSKREIRTKRKNLIGQNEDGSYTCPECGKIILTKKLLHHHLYDSHKAKTYQCNICSKEFNKNYLLKQHILQHTGERPYSCKYCNKMFYRSNTLNTHLLIHKDKTYLCEICAKKFTLKTSLIKHLEIHKECFIRKKQKIDERKPIPNNPDLKLIKIIGAIKSINLKKNQKL